MNPNISQYGKESRFTSENQPSPEAKSVPKWRTKFKKMLNDPECLKAFEKQIKEGNVRAWNLMFERIHGKVKDKIEHSGKVETSDIKEVIKDLKKSLSNDN